MSCAQFFSLFFSAGGGIVLEHCTVTEDGVRTALEFNAIRWGGHDLPHQAGIAVYERGPTGKLHEARIYDDVEGPVEALAYRRRVSQPPTGDWGALSRPSFMLPTIVGLVALAVYVRTLLPGLAFGDWGEMQTVPHVLGVAHPTGYPTYIILGWLAHLVPIGSIAFRANLLSAVLVSGALGVTVAILLRLGTRPAIAGGAALLLGAVGTVWAAATVAEVNPLHLLFVALLLHRALVWEEDRRPRDLIIGAALLGLAVGNHLLILFVAPFVVLFVLWVGRREIAANPRILVAPSPPV